MTLRLAMSFLNQIKEYTILQDLREKNSEYCLNPDGQDSRIYRIFNVSSINREVTHYENTIL